MAINFPSSPTPGQKYPSSPITGLPVYVWDGLKWTTQGGAIGTGGAPLDSPILIGNPQAPTPLAGDNDTSVATTAFVTAAIAAAIAALPTTASAAEFLANSQPTKILSSGAVWTASAPLGIADTGGIITPNFALACDFACSLTGTSRTLANPVSMKVGQKGIIYLIGGSVTTWGSAYRWPNGLKPVSTGGWDLVSYIVWSDAATVFCTFAGNVA